MFELEKLQISGLGHSSFKIKEEKTIYIDPYQINEKDKADIILISHDHFDHLEIESINKISTSKTIIISPPSGKNQLKSVESEEIIFVTQNDEIEILGIKIKTVPAHNTNKFKEPGKFFHPKEEGGVGYILTISGTKLYYAGDSDQIQEMNNIKPDILLIPVSGTYVMTWEEAVKATSSIQPKIAIPMHWGAIAGNIEDAKKFKENASCEVIIFEKE